jgi:hypothetical protein
MTLRNSLTCSVEWKILVDEHNIVTDAKTGERCALTTNIVFKSFIS